MSREFKSFFKQAGGSETKCYYPTRLDTYGCGCQHDCSYCYAKSLLSFRNLWKPNDPAVANLNKIERIIKKLPKGSVIRLGGMTDCFQPCEVEYRTTYNTIKLLNKYGIGYLIVTKSHLIGEPKYIEILDKELAHIQITVTTLDDERSVEYEKASVPSKRINTWIKKWFNVDYSKYSIKWGGYEHLPLEEKKRIISKVKIPTISVCEDVDSHYNYWKDHQNPNRADCCNLRGSHNKEIIVEKKETIEQVSLFDYEN